MKKKSFLLIAVVSMLLAGSSFGAARWYGPGNDWSNPDNWQFAFPSQSVNVTFLGRTLSSGPIPCNIPAGYDAECKILHLGYNVNNADALLNVYGTLNVGPTNQSVYVGSNANFQGTLNVETGGLITIGDGGRISAGRYGSGYINVNGGTIDTPVLKIAEETGSSGEVYINSGSIDLRNAFVPAGNGFVDILDGTLTMPKFLENVDVYDNITQWIADDIIIGYGGTKNRQVNEYMDGSEYRYEISAVPEPATFCLFGISSCLMLIRRNNK